MHLNGRLRTFLVRCKQWDFNSYTWTVVNGCTEVNHIYFTTVCKTHVQSHSEVFCLFSIHCTCDSSGTKCRTQNRRNKLLPQREKEQEKQVCSFRTWVHIHHLCSYVTITIIKGQNERRRGKKTIVVTTHNNSFNIH